MNDISDTVMTLAAVACFAEGPTTIRNVAHIRHKETDRLAALATELRKVGAEVEEFADGLTHHAAALARCRNRDVQRSSHGDEHGVDRSARCRALSSRIPAAWPRRIPISFATWRSYDKSLSHRGHRDHRGIAKMFRFQQATWNSTVRRFAHSLRLPPCILCVLCVLCGSSFAALDPEAKKPYLLTIVLRVAPHRLLTPVFKGSFRAEPRDSLQASLGKVAEVRVVTDHSLLKEIDVRGLQAVLDSLEKGPARSGKLHFVLIDFVDGHYTIHSGQYDGLTGLATPAVRQARTDDRQFVAKQAALAIERDFGMVGTVGKKLDGGQVEVVLKGGALGEAVHRSVQKGQVFAIAQVQQTSSGQRTGRVREAYLQVVEGPKDGVCVCRLFNRYRDDASKLVEKPGVLGYRCLKLGTDEGPLRLRLVDDKGLPMDGLQVEVGRHGFDRPGDFKPRHHQGGTLPFDSEKYDHLAFVKVLYRRTLIAQVPVAILAGRTAVCRVSIADPNELVGQVHVRRKRLIERLLESLQVQDDLRKGLRELLSKSKQDQTLHEARDGLKSLKADLADLDAESVSLGGFGEVAPEIAPVLGEIDKLLAALRLPMRSCARLSPIWTRSSQSRRTTPNVRNC